MMDAYADMFADLPDLLTPAQVARELSVSRQTVNGLCRAGRIPCVQISDRRRVIPKCALIEWTKENTHA